MKIVLCLNHFLPEYIAGTEMYTFHLARHLKLMGAEAIVLIPNFGLNCTEEYLYEGVRIIKYPESSIEDKEMILGKTKPGGLEIFADILQKEQPDIVHFNELTQGRGISIFHVEAAASLGIRTILTCHVANYSCNTGNLKYKDEDPCDGQINIMKCTNCSFYAKGILGMRAKVLLAGAGIIYYLGIDTTFLRSSLGTALAFPLSIQLKRKRLLQLAKMVDTIVVLTKWYKANLEINGISPEKITFIPQGLTGLRRVKKEGVNQLCALPLKIVFIGRIDYLKGVHLILEAVQQLPVNKLTLDIYGQDRDDAYAHQCRQIADGLTNIKWKGSIAGADVIDMLADYDLLCLPSTFSEMSPLVIQEAFAAGIPILASDANGNAEQIKDGVNGWLFKFKSSLDLTNKLNMLIEQPDLIDKAKQSIPQVNDFKNVAAQYFRLYTSILEKEADIKTVVS